MFKITQAKEEEKVIPDIEIAPVFEEIDYEQIRKDAEQRALASTLRKKIEDELDLYIYGREVFEATTVAMKEPCPVSTPETREKHPKANTVYSYNAGGRSYFGFSRTLEGLIDKLTKDFLETMKD